MRFIQWNSVIFSISFSISNVETHFFIHTFRAFYKFCNLILASEGCQSLCNSMTYHSHPSNFAWGWIIIYLKHELDVLCSQWSILHGRLFNYVWNCQLLFMLQGRNCYTLYIIYHTYNCFILKIDSPEITKYLITCMFESWN